MITHEVNALNSQGILVASTHTFVCTPAVLDKNICAAISYNHGECRVNHIYEIPLHVIFYKDVGNGVLEVTTMVLKLNKSIICLIEDQHGTEEQMAVEYVERAVGKVYAPTKEIFVDAMVNEKVAA